MGRDNVDPAVVKREQCGRSQTCTGCLAFLGALHDARCYTYAVARKRHQRQDGLSDQMRDVMQYAVESGCYDAHDWLTKAWGSRHGICGHEPNLVVSLATGKIWCVLTAGHDGAHQSDGPYPVRWKP